MRGFLLALLISGCGTDSGSDTELTSGETEWVTRALPVLRDAGCTSCHSNVDPATPGNDFLAGATPQAIRDTLIMSAVVDLGIPTQSRLITKGAHAGVPLTAEQTTAILIWLEAE